MKQQERSLPDVATSWRGGCDWPRAGLDLHPTRHIWFDRNHVLISQWWWRRAEISDRSECRAFVDLGGSVEVVASSGATVVAAAADDAAVGAGATAGAQGVRGRGHVVQVTVTQCEQLRLVGQQTQVVL